MRIILNKLLYLFIIFLFVSGCTRRPKEVLKSSEMTKILVDMHIADGVFSIDKYKELSGEEKVLYYQSVLSKYHVTQSQFDSSVVWYSYDPKRFEKIYNKVIIQLTDYEEDVKNGKYTYYIPSDTLPQSAEVDIWTQPVLFEFNKNTRRNHIPFVITDTALMTQDTYLLRFRQRIQPADSCENQHAVFYIHYANGRTDSLCKELHADGKLRKYTLRLRASVENKIDSLSGYLLMSDTCPKIPQSAYTDSISIIRTYNPSIQGDLRKKIELLEQKSKGTKDFLFLSPKNNIFLFPSPRGEGARRAGEV